MQPDSTPQSSTTSQPVVTPPRRDTPKKRLILIIAVIVTTVLVASAAFYLWKSTSDRAALLQSSPAEVVITASGFEPATIKISKGQSLTWINEDSAVHQLAADQPELADLAIDELDTGDSLDFTFEESGTFTYYDPLNPNSFKGAVIVE
jgi:plastocyanin